MLCPPMFEGFVVSGTETNVFWSKPSSQPEKQFVYKPWSIRCATTAFGRSPCSNNSRPASTADSLARNPRLRRGEAQIHVTTRICPALVTGQIDTLNRARARVRTTSVLRLLGTGLAIPSSIVSEWRALERGTKQPCPSSVAFRGRYSPMYVTGTGSQPGNTTLSSEEPKRRRDCRPTPRCHRKR